MTKGKSYSDTMFSGVIIKAAIAEYYRQLAIEDEDSMQQNRSRATKTVWISSAKWEHDTEEEFFADYQNCYYAEYKVHGYGGTFRITFNYPDTSIRISAKTRASIESVFSVFDAHRDSSRIVIEPTSKTPLPKASPSIFIGHGHSTLWRELKDHLQDKHGFDVIAYETGARSGHAIRDILEEMLKKSSFALLVLTGEDETSEGKLRARQNVIHEAGLFQGKLGFSRAIILLEEETEPFSNVAGIDYLKFSKGNIKEVFGEVIAILKREFS
ncbi:MAG TPA: nucleotide-binding protein [Rhodothermales bacterium]|nr:nucleotide-binding protein [Rhodothermales bacterium]